MWNANLCDGGWSRTQGLLHSCGFHSSTGPNRPQCASMVLLRATMGHTHRVDAKVRKATADRSNRQGKLDVIAAGRWGPSAMDRNLLGVVTHRSAIGTSGHADRRRLREAIHLSARQVWIASSRSLSSGAHSRDPRWLLAMTNSTAKLPDGQITSDFQK